MKVGDLVGIGWNSSLNSRNPAIIVRILRERYNGHDNDFTVYVVVAADGVERWMTRWDLEEWDYK